MEASRAFTIECSRRNTELRELRRPREKQTNKLIGKDVRFVITRGGGAGELDVGGQR